MTKYAWVITVDHIETDAVGTLGPGGATMDVDAIKKAGAHFRMYDADGELYYQRSQAANGVYSIFLVDPHRLGRDLLAVLAVTVLNFLKLGLQIGHPFQRMALLHR